MHTYFLVVQIVQADHRNCSFDKAHEGEIMTGTASNRNDTLLKVTCGNTNLQAGRPNATRSIQRTPAIAIEDYFDKE